MPTPKRANRTDEFDADRLWEIVERIEQAADMIHDLTRIRQDAYEDARRRGFDIGALRDAVTHRRAAARLRLKPPDAADLYRAGLKRSRL